MRYAPKQKNSRSKERCSGNLRMAHPARNGGVSHRKRKHPAGGGNTPFAHAPHPAAGNSNTRKGRGATRGRKRLTPETEASRGGQQHAIRARAPPRAAPHHAAGNKDAPPHNDAAGRRGRNRIRRAVNRACYFISTSECPVISAGCSRPISLSTVGATSARMPL